MLVVTAVMAVEISSSAKSQSNCLTLPYGNGQNDKKLRFQPFYFSRTGISNSFHFVFPPFSFDMKEKSVFKWNAAFSLSNCFRIRLNNNWIFVNIANDNVIMWSNPHVRKKRMLRTYLFASLSSWYPSVVSAIFIVCWGERKGDPTVFKNRECSAGTNNCISSVFVDQYIQPPNRPNKTDSFPRNRWKGIVKSIHKLS